MTNIILITNGSRPRLLEQTLRTLRDKTPTDQYNLTVVCDGPYEDAYPDDPGLIDTVFWNDEKVSSVTVDPACRVIGRLKNLGAYWSEKQFGRGEWLLFIDDDVAFFPGWLDKMHTAMESSNQLRLLGGVRHPYHQTDTLLNGGIEITDAVAGYCHFMRWSTWDRFGPYDATAKGTGQSEDYALSRKIVEAGGTVGYIHPPVMAHCGITDSNGKTILGAELIEQVPGILYE